LIILILLGKAYTCEAPHCAVFSNVPHFNFLSGPNVLLSTLFSNTFSLCSLMSNMAENLQK
jgi:hypothetical protein